MWSVFSSSAEVTPDDDDVGHEESKETLPLLDPEVGVSSGAPPPPTLPPVLATLAGLEGGASGGAVAARLGAFGGLGALLPGGPAPAVLGTLGALPPVTHAALRALCGGGLAAPAPRDDDGEGPFDLTRFGVASSTDRVAVAMPNGPDAALALLAVAARCACAPLNERGTVDELAAEVSRDIAHHKVVYRIVTTTLWCES